MLTKRQEAEMEVADLKMLRFSLGMIIMDKIRNNNVTRALLRLERTMNLLCH